MLRPVPPVSLLCALLLSDIAAAGQAAPPKLEASSELRSKKGRRYSVENIRDGSLQTAWVEGKPDAGEGAWLRYSWSSPVEIYGFVLAPGYAKSAALFEQNATPRSVSLRVDGKNRGEYTVPYRMRQVADEIATTVGGQEALGCYHVGTAHEQERVVLFRVPIRGQTFELRIEKVLHGIKYRDLAISEWRLLREGRADAHLSGPQRTAFESIRTLRGKRAGSKMSKQITRSIDIRTFVREVWAQAQAIETSECALLGTCDGAVSESERIASARSYRIIRTYKEPKYATKDAPQAAELYLQYHRFAFFDRILTVSRSGKGLAVVGGLAARAGDGEWVELYPRLVLDRRGHAVEVGEVRYSDGSPGCHDAFPATMSR